MEDSAFLKAIIINAMFSSFAFYLTLCLIPGLSDMFIRKNMFGIDLSKKAKIKVYV